jgi:hypothetical protein
MRKGTRALLQSAKRREVTVEIPELDAEFTLREMSGTERDKFDGGIFKGAAQIKIVDGKPSGLASRELDTLYFRARLVALCLVEEDGNRMYADDEIQQLSDAIPSRALSVLFEAAQKLNGLDQAAVEAAAKNSASVPTDASASALPSP